MDNLVKSCKYNEERCDALLKYKNEYQRSISLGTVCVNNMTSSNTSFSLPKLYDSTITKKINLKSNSYNEQNNSDSKVYYDHWYWKSLTNKTTNYNFFFNFFTLI
ncbi:unnamed protein product [Parnassius mnemosyne]|uniref:Uncharacterized protein n=1 Tax=Parnassius mnemosyne TaxID=213953 RepID=A0AAV1M652_9NEOP